MCSAHWVTERIELTQRDLFSAIAKFDGRAVLKSNEYDATMQAWVPMRITLLGTGDATGTPVIGCDCPTCQDAHHGGRRQRTRSAILVESDKGKVLIDTGPDLRAQLLESGIGRLMA